MVSIYEIRFTINYQRGPQNWIQKVLLFPNGVTNFSATKKNSKAALPEKSISSKRQATLFESVGFSATVPAKKLKRKVLSNTLDRPIETPADIHRVQTCPSQNQTSTASSTRSKRVFFPLVVPKPQKSRKDSHLLFKDLF